MRVELARRADAGVVDDQVECPESLARQIEEPLPVGLDRQVGGERDDPCRFSSRANEPLGDRGEPLAPSGRSG